MKDELARIGAHSLTESVESLMKSVGEWKGDAKFSDDLTLLALEITPEG